MCPLLHFHSCFLLSRWRGAEKGEKWFQRSRGTRRGGMRVRDASLVFLLSWSSSRPHSTHLRDGQWCSITRQSAYMKCPPNTTQIPPRQSASLHQPWFWMRRRSARSHFENRRRQTHEPPRDDVDETSKLDEIVSEEGRRRCIQWGRGTGSNVRWHYQWNGILWSWLSTTDSDQRNEGHWR